MADGGAEEEDAELLRLRLHPGAPRWQRQLAAWLQHRARLPEWVVAALFSLGWRWWGGLLAWMLTARLSAHYELGEWVGGWGSAKLTVPGPSEPECLIVRLPRLWRAL